MAYRDEVLADSPTGYWELEETSGSTVADASGSGHTGTVFGANLDVTGQVGSAASFDGTDDLIDVGGVISTLPDEFTLEAWVRLSSEPSGTKGIIAFANTSEAFKYVMLGMSDDDHAGQRFFVQRRAIASNVGRVYADSFAAGSNLNVWLHVVGTITGGDSAELYVNGSLEAAGSTNSGAASVGLGSIGALKRSSGVVDYWPGLIDEPAAYGARLSSERVTAHYDAAFAAGPVGPFLRTTGGYLRTPNGILRPA